MNKKYTLKNVPALGNSSRNPSEPEEIEDDIKKFVDDDYDTRYVAFVDILGFKERIRGAEKNVHRRKQDIATLVNALTRDFSDLIKEYAGVDSGSSADYLEFYTFSDFIAISAVASHQGLDALIFAAWTISEDLLTKGFLTRGGVAKGLVFHASNQSSSKMNFIFGPAFIDAYELESQVAEFPRIIFHQKVREEYLRFKKKKLLGHSEILVQRFEDGPYGIDVFAKLADTKESRSKLGAPDKDFLLYKDKLLELVGGSMDTPRHFKKVKWAIDRYNKYVEGRTDKSISKIVLN